MRTHDPNRKHYRRTFDDEGDCVFCSTDETLEIPALSGNSWRAVINKYPYMDGNMMVIPARHIVQIDDITPIEWEEFGRTLVGIKQALAVAFEVDSYNVGLNLGPESGASIAHIHWQIVPRKFKNLTTMNTFADLYLVQISPEEAKAKIEQALKNLPASHPDPN